MPDGAERPVTSLQERILDLILRFPSRLDAMETRNEENCRILAFRISELVDRELRRRRRLDHPGGSVDR